MGTHPQSAPTCIECGGEADYAGSSTPKKSQHCKNCWLTIGALKPGSGASDSDKKRARRHIAFREMIFNSGPGMHLTLAGRAAGLPSGGQVVWNTSDTR